MNLYIVNKHIQSNYSMFSPHMSNNIYLTMKSIITILTVIMFLYSHDQQAEIKPSTLNRYNYTNISNKSIKAYNGNNTTGIKIVTWNKQKAHLINRI